MSRPDILALDRFWVLEVIFHPRDPQTGAPLFGEEEDATGWLERLARRRGYDPGRALAWAREREKEYQRG